MNKLVYVCMVFSSKYETMLGYRSRRKLSFPFGTVKSFGRHHQVVAETRRARAPSFMAPGG